MFAGNPQAFSMSEFHDPKTVKSHQSLAMLYRCNNRAENELFNKNYIENQLNNNIYNAIEWNRDSWLNWI